METGLLEQYLESSRHRLESLVSRAEELQIPAGECWERSLDYLSDPKTLLQESLQELSQALEELQVASEQLHQQNEELLNTQLALRQERQYYKDLFDFAPDGYLVTNVNGSIQDANQAVLELLNISSNRLIGKPLVVFIPEHERRNFRQQLLSLQQGQPLRNWQVLLQLRSGNQVFVICTVIPVKNSLGQVMSLRWRIQEIAVPERPETSQESLVEQLNRLYESNLPSEISCSQSQEETQPIPPAPEKKKTARNRLFNLACEKATIGVALLDRSGHVIECNTELQRMFGYSQQQLKQISLLKLTHPYDRKIERDLFKMLMAGERNCYHLEKRYMCQNGQVKTGLASVFLVRDDNQDPLLAMCVFREIPGLR